MATKKERADWQGWLHDSAEHREAWRYVETISQRFGPLQSLPDPQTAVRAFQELGGKRRQRRRLLSGMAVLAGMSMFGWSIWRQTPLTDQLLALAADYRTGTGEIREITLSDNTRVWLNTASAFDVDYRSTLRRLALLAGEMLINTASDGDRPFVVDVRQGRLRALGTRFTVRLTETTTSLTVYEGAVEIRTADTGKTHIVEMGQQVHFTETEISPPKAADQAREAWTRGVLLAEDIPLCELVAELGRYRPGYLGVSPEIAELRVLGGYPLRDSDKTLSMLESVLPVEIKRPLPWWVSIEAKR